MFEFDINLYKNSDLRAAQRVLISKFSPSYTCHGLIPGIHHSLAALLVLSLGLFVIWMKRRKSWYVREGCAQIGYAKSVREIQAIVGAIVAKKNALDSMVVSHGWWDQFQQRHPHLTLRSAEGLAYCHAVSTNRVVVLINTLTSWRKYLRAIPRNHISSSMLMRLACDYNIVKERELQCMARNMSMLTS